MRGQLNYYAACEMSRETEAAVFERRDRLLCETASQPNYASHGPIPLLEPCFEAIMRLEKARWGSASGCKTLANQPRHFLYTPGRRFLTAENAYHLLIASPKSERCELPRI